jgi:hypothetical protein
MHYGLTSEDLCNILDSKDLFRPNFPRETFRVLQEKEEHGYHEYRTRRLIREAWDVPDDRK